MSLTGAVVRILPEDQDLHIGMRGEMNGGKHFIVGWEHGVHRSLRRNKVQ